MAVMDTVLGLIADIGLDAAKGRYKITRDELQARAKLTDYLARQQKYNFNCSLEEEIDFEGLAEYIRSNLMDDVKNRLFGTRKERGIARQAIADKAAYYDQLIEDNHFYIAWYWMKSVFTIYINMQNFNFYNNHWHL